MKKYSVSVLSLIFVSAFVLIDGSVLSLVAVFFSLLHEICHVVCLKIIGGRVKRLSARGFSMALDTTFLNYSQECAVALSGPALSLLLFFVFLPFCKINEYLFFCCFCNLMIFSVNILPVYPLDGGRALYCFLCKKYQLYTSNIIMRVISCIFLLPLLIMSVIILIRTGYNLSLLVISVYLALLVLGVKDL